VCESGGHQTCCVSGVEEVCVEVSRGDGEINDYCGGSGSCRVLL
jgi:hypothetical protein